MSRAARKHEHGVGALCSVLLSRLHPRDVIADAFPNQEHRERIDGLVCIRKEKKTVSRNEQECYVFWHEKFDNNDVYCICRWSRVTEACPEGQEFQVYHQDDDGEETQLHTEEEILDEEEEEMEEGLFREILTAGASDIELVRASRYDMDNNNEPAPENLPATNATMVHQKEPS